MSAHEPKHRLAAIVVADVVGYTRMMEADEAGTLSLLRAARADVVDPVTARHRGAIVKGTGDGWLAQFRSVTDAVRSSVEIQAAMARRNALAAEGRRFEFRIGINLGEVVVESDDIYGTGVNVAARLESLADPGGIVISSAVRDQLRGVAGLEFEDMGPRAVKNLANPVHCFNVRPTAPPAAHGDPGAAAQPAARSERASIAVLPFSNLSGDADQDYFADGVVDDIITALSRFKWLRVIARNSTFAYKGRAVDVRQIARDLGVRYVLEGSVRKSGRRVRITGQLIDATTGDHVWADNFNGAFEDIFDLQDSITESVVGTMEPQLRKAEIERARRKRPENLDAYDLFLRALPHVYAMRPDDNRIALDLLEAASRLDPTYAPPLAFRAWCLEQRVVRRWPAARDDDAATCLRLARAALAADMDDANAIAIAAFVALMVGRDFDAAFPALRRAVALNPNNAFVAMNAGWAHCFAGDLGEALAHLERARALSPNDPTAFYVLTGLGMAHLLAGRCEEGARLATDAAALYDEWDATYYVLAAAQGHLGRLDEARASIARLVALIPGASIARYREMVPIRDPERLAFLEKGLRVAGLPERTDPEQARA
ncbi:MAG: adenylate/guanylate cyclase domain-containing protein [Betaproteobacteria bacterium]|nr:adenylate/guanylate cyclase domain-containing protein [Betaproteobacteria bacterium]